MANFKYATVRADPATGRLYLYMKTIERFHQPSKLWERYRLNSNYAKALQQISERLEYWPKFLQHKCKQRLTRLTQVAIRMRRLAAEEDRLGEKLVPKLAPKIRRREEARERKAEAAAKLERTIERELIERLRQGAYGDQPLNVSETIWQKVLTAMEKEGQGIRDKDHDKGIEEDDEEELEEEYEEEDEDELDGNVEYVSDVEESDEELGDIEDWLGSDEDDDEDEDDEEEDSDDAALKKKGKAAVGDKRKRGRVVRMKARKRREREVEEESERHKLLAF